MSNDVRLVFIHAADYERVSQTARALIGDTRTKATAERVCMILSAAQPAGKDRVQLRLTDEDAETLTAFWNRFEFSEAAT
jgi:hypothetical protein